MVTVEKEPAWIDTSELGQELSKSLEAKEVRLPSGVRRHIRRLKEEGRWEEAMSLRRQEAGKKTDRTREGKLQDLLNQNIKDLMLAKNPNQEAALTIEAIWLLEKKGEIEPEERFSNLMEVLNNTGVGLEEEQLVLIRDKIAKI